jgi:hypothetical protein
MLRLLIVLSALAACANAALWPDQFGSFPIKTRSAADLPAASRAVFAEDGFQSAEQADYGAFQVTAWKFKDATGAFAASLEPFGQPVSRVGNVVVACTGSCPGDFLKLAGALATGPRSGPLLSEALPTKGFIAGSERYVIGPVGLKENAPQIPESAVAFQFETEGDLRLFRSSQGNQLLAVFSYPTMQMARQQTPAFAAIPNATVKRTDSVVAVVIPVGDHPVLNSAAAQALVSGIRYQTSVEQNETPPLQLKPETAGQMILSIFALAGIVVGFCVVSGLVFAGVRVATRKFGHSDAHDAMTTLHLEGK